MSMSWMRIDKHTGTNWGNKKGRRTEDRFFEAMEVSFVKKMLVWVFDVCRASQKEDAKGIDAVIATDVGKLFIQIKSSEAGAIKFRNGRNCRHRMIRVIIIREDHSLLEIREKAKNILIELRQSILNLRGNID